MIKKEFCIKRNDGIDLFRSYSDEGKYIIQKETGYKYTEAVDVEESKFTYEETDEKIKPIEENSDEASLNEDDISSNSDN